MYVSFIMVILYGVSLKLKFVGELVIGRRVSFIYIGEGERFACMGDRDERVRVESAICVCVWLSSCSWRRWCPRIFGFGGGAFCGVIAVGVAHGNAGDVGV